MSRINTNTQAMAAHTALSKTNSEMSTRQLRLATGSRLNRAEDDSAGYTLASKLGSKIRGQAQALANIGDAKNLLSVGEGSLSSVMDILQTMKEKATQAANDTMNSDERTAIGTQLTALRDELDSVLTKTEFNGRKLFEGDGVNPGSQLNLSFQVGGESADNFAVSIDRLAATELGLAGGAASVEHKYDSNWGTAGGAFAVIDSGIGTYAGQADTFTFEVAAVDGTAGAERVDFKVTNSAGDSQIYSYDATNGGAAGIATNLGAGMLEDLEINFNASDGTALNASAESQANFQVGDKFSLAVKSGTVNVSDAANSRATINTIDSAISTVASSMSKIGDAQSRLSFKSENLQSSMTNYEAAKSRIADADFAKEQMQIVKLQILQQTGTASLAQANAAPQSVLSLF